MESLKGLVPMLAAVFNVLLQAVAVVGTLLVGIGVVFLICMIIAGMELMDYCDRRKRRAIS